jgi:hypothetical protein
VRSYSSSSLFDLPSIGVSTFDNPLGQAMRRQQQSHWPTCGGFTQKRRYQTSLGLDQP